MSDARSAARDEITRGENSPPERSEPALAAVPGAEPDTRLKLAPFRPFEESTAALSPRLQRSLLVRGASRMLQLVCILYAIFLLYWVWIAKDSGLAVLLDDPLFYGYSLLVSLYVVTRFVLAPFYRASPDVGYRPTCSIVVPAFNEEECIEATIDACLTSDYPEDRLEVVVIDDGSTDGTWERMLLARERHPRVVCVRFPQNRGKRDGMAEGIRRSSGEICIFIDSDSVVEPDGLAHLVADFEDERVGAVVGHADVLNKTANWLTRMQQVRYYIAFRVIKGCESLFGAVTCASGCFSAYRRTTLLEVLDRWEHQRFLGRRATFGDDRALTNYVLRHWRITYQSQARSHTLVPERIRVFGVQQLRWKKSWLRESLHVSSFIWRKHPVAAFLTYLGCLFPWIAPIVVLHSVWFRAVSVGSPLFYLVGAYVMAVLYSLYYAITRRSPLWWHGISFVAIYMCFLVWQTYYALFTIRNTSWGTRASTHSDTGGEIEVVGPVLEEPAA